MALRSGPAIVTVTPTSGCSVARSTMTPDSSPVVACACAAAAAKRQTSAAALRHIELERGAPRAGVVRAARVGVDRFAGRAGDDCAVDQSIDAPVGVGQAAQR